MKCSNCGKGILYGHNVSHSKRRTRKIFKPNLHVARIAVNGIVTKMKLCTKCQRLMKKVPMFAKAKSGSRSIIGKVVQVVAAV